MKKYHLADLFTLVRGILAVVLFIMAICAAPPTYALVVFVAGELCDAVDGPCARRWHYPDDGKYRWWRRYHVQTDQAADIILAIACGVYLIWRVDVWLGTLLLGGIGGWCLLMQKELVYLKRLAKQDPKFADFCERQRESIILLRRKVYVYVGIGGAILVLIWHTGWPTWICTTITLIGVLVGIILTQLKSNRLNEDQTPL